MSPQLHLILGLDPHNANGTTSTVGPPISFGVHLGLILATLLCAVITLFLYRRSPRTWYWFASAVIGGIIAYVLYSELLRSSGISQQFALILSLVLAALLYAVSIFLYRRSGISTKTWYATIGTAIAILLFFAFVGFFLPGFLGLLMPQFVTYAAYWNIIFTLWQRSRTR